MGRPKKVTYNLKEKVAKIRAAGLEAKTTDAPPDKATVDLLPLPERLQQLLQLVKDPNKNKYDMVYLVMYDIENDKVRTQIAKYLISKGCMRIQKSVYVARTHHKVFDEISTALKEIQAAYDNHDSIVLAPVQTATLQSMKIIGKQIELQTLVDPPNTLFY